MTRRGLAALLLLSLGCAARGPRAQVVEDVEAKAREAQSKRPTIAVAIPNGPERPQVRAEQVRFEDLPTIAPLSPQHPSQPHDFAQDIGRSSAGAVTMTLTTREPKLAMIRFGPYRGWSGGPYPSIVPAAVFRCGDAHDLAKPRAARWLTLERAEGGGLEVTLNDGTFDPPGCTVALAHRLVARPALLLESAELYGFKVCEGACERGDIVFVFPRTGALVADGVDLEHREIGSFSVVTVPFARGSAASVMTELDKIDVRRFESVMMPERPLIQDSTFGMEAPSVFVEIEILQGTRDRTPSVTLFTTEGQAQLGRIDFESPFQGEPPDPLIEQPSPQHKDRCGCARGDPMCSCL